LVTSADGIVTRSASSAISLDAPSSAASGCAIVTSPSSTSSATMTAFAPACCARHAFSTKKHSPRSTRTTVLWPTPVARETFENAPHPSALEASYVTSPMIFAP
jgi:hypothetical protein